jgi:type IV pilus assembly protein PilM
MELNASVIASDLVQKIQKRAIAGNSFIGVDIGSSSTKIVQLSLDGDVAKLETYGEIENALYGDTEPGKSATVSPSAHSAELSDLLHEVKAQSRRCAVAIPLSGTLINTVDLPKRDPEQMRLIIPGEAKKYIPVPITDVMLDWYALPEAETDAFDTVRAQTPVAPQFQKVMIVAITNETAHGLGDMVKGSELTCEFYEIEMFSTVRACAHTVAASTLILDLGASAIKAYIVNDRWLTLAARSVPSGGQMITQEVMKALSCDFNAAERAKREQGLGSASAARAAITAALSPLWTYVEQMTQEHRSRGGKPIERILLSGGGSYMPGISEMISSTLSIPVEVIRAFDRTKGPMILENTLRDDGPRFAVAVGLALRGIGK